MPVLIDGDTVVADSWAIVRHADSIGTGAPLIPGAREAEIQRWREIADAGMQAGRGLVVAALLDSPAALDEDAAADPCQSGCGRRCGR